MASIFDKQLLSNKDLERINELETLYLSATDTKTKNEILALAEGIRNSYGYSGGEDGKGYSVIDAGTVGAAAALGSYTDTLRDAQKAQNEAYEKTKEQNTLSGNERLRQAYIKNMQNKNGVSSALRTNGITGGYTESTLAAMDSDYMNLRDSILAEVRKANSDIDAQKIESGYKTESDIGKIEYDAATYRADKLTEAEKEEYERNLAEMKLALERDELDYQKIKDELDRDYQIKKDALDRANELKKVEKSASTSAKVQSESEALEERKKAAWELLEKGVYDESFPELLGFSEQVLLMYAENCMAGF